MLYDAVQGLRAYLASSPLAWLFATVATYVFATWLYRKAGHRQIFHPVLISVLILSAILYAAEIQYRTYFEGAQFIHFFLGPVTVMLAVPLYKSLHLIREASGAILASLAVGSLVAALPAVAVGAWLGADPDITRSLVAKSVTTPVALGISEKIGGINAITAVVVVFTGVIGGIIATAVFRMVGIRDPRAQGFALGLAAHGLGVGRALQIDSAAAAFASLAMGFNALITALWAPAVIPWFLQLVGVE